MARKRRQAVIEPVEIALANRLKGQQHVIDAVAPYVTMHQAGLAPEGRPLGIFLLLGPSGTGKTKTVEALAEVIHGTEKHVLRIDCGEFQMEHEVAKLIGAPPGYLGHRETQPILTQQRLNGITSERSNISLVLFDEIEKSADSMRRILLGVFDKAALKLGDSNNVNFERSIIFLTSNLGAREMLNYLTPSMGFKQEGAETKPEEDLTKLHAIGLSAAKKKFSPEFINRIDAIITYKPLSEEIINDILEIQIEQLQHHIHRRLGSRAFNIDINKQAKEFLIGKGVSKEFGARELKRTIHKHLMQPLSAMVAAGKIMPQMLVRIGINKEKDGLKFYCKAPKTQAAV